MQKGRNDECNEEYDKIEKFGVDKASYYFKMNTTSVKKCMQNFGILFCRVYFPSCDRTLSVIKKKKICRKTCEELILTDCGHVIKILLSYYIIRFPERRDAAELYFHCKLQPKRNAGESPECWYLNRHARITGNTTRKQYPYTVSVCTSSL